MATKKEKKLTPSGSGDRVTGDADGSAVAGSGTVIHPQSMSTLGLPLGTSDGVLAGWQTTPPLPLSPATAAGRPVPPSPGSLGQSYSPGTAVTSIRAPDSYRHRQSKPYPPVGPYWNPTWRPGRGIVPQTLPHPNALLSTPATWPRLIRIAP